MITEPEILILTSKYDTSCDFVILKLFNKKVKYLRLNKEDYQDFYLTLDPVSCVVEGYSEKLSFRITQDSLKSIWYRRPTFLRKIDLNTEDVSVYFEKYQWMTFTRSFIIFEKSKWINHPTATFSAENKPYQIKIASELGFDIPKTIITNSSSSFHKYFNDMDVLVVKSLDTFHFRDKKREYFAYTKMYNKEYITSSILTSAPAIFQQPLLNKIDIRVTVIGNEVFAISITDRGKPIEGDWRLLKDRAVYKEYNLPSDIKEKCVNLTANLGLLYGAIDLALVDNKYYFLEINPTGEWAWIDQHTNFRLDEKIADLLIG